MAKIFTEYKELVRRSKTSGFAWTSARKLFRLVLSLGIGSGLIMGFPRLITAGYAARRSYSLAHIPPKRVAIVFGAEVYRDGTPTAILKDRVEAAASLYLAGKVEKLLMSGDNRFVDYNEPQAMQQYAIGLGVPEKDIVLDYAGLRTYDTCYRARAIFEVDDVILVTQGWHLQRALFTCNMLGVQAVGLPSDGPRQYSWERKTYWALRELPATLAAFWEVLISRPLPILGNPEPIFENNPIQALQVGLIPAAH